MQYNLARHPDATPLALEINFIVKAPVPLVAQKIPVVPLPEYNNGAPTFIPS